MSKEEIFHRQLINSYVKHVATTPYEEFMVRSELTRRTRGFIGGMGPDVPQYARASTAIFFGSDRQAYETALSESHPDLSHTYNIETFGGGLTTIKGMDYDV